MSNGNEFIGQWVELNCGDLGNFVGEIVSVNSEKITLTKAQNNGKPCASVYVTFNGEFLQDMKFLDGPPNGLPIKLDAQSIQQSVHVSHGPKPTKAGNKMNKSMPPNLTKQVQNKGDQASMAVRMFKNPNHLNTKEEDSCRSQTDCSASINSEEHLALQSIMNTPVMNTIKLSSGDRSDDRQDDRREKLRSIPNTLTAYICPVSPPALRRSSSRHEDTFGQEATQQFKKDSQGYVGTSGNNAFKPYRRRSYSDDKMITSGLGDVPNLRAGQKNNKKQNRTTPKNSWLFSDVEEVIREEFDFEKNLALFDKAAFYQETGHISPGGNGKVKSLSPPQNRGDCFSKPDLVRGVEAKYQCNQNVLSSAVNCPSADSRELIVLPSAFCNTEEISPPWMTDQCRFIPVLDNSFLRTRLFDKASELGLTWVRSTELAGRGLAEFIIQQMGGDERLAIHNMHQVPHVVFLLNNNKTGSLGLATARHLRSREVDVTVSVPEESYDNEYCQEFQSEMQLYKLIGCQRPVLIDTKFLPDGPVDLIVSCIEEFDCPPPSDKYSQILFKWCSNQKAPILALNPPLFSTLSWKLCVQLVLPSLPYNRMVCKGSEGNYWPPAGRTYLLDMGITRNIFERVGIKYLSPFSAKSVIALHPPKPGIKLF